MPKAMQKIPAEYGIDRGMGLEEQIDWGRYFQVLNRHKWMIIGSAVAAGLIAALILIQMDPVYRSTATLLIESQQPKVLGIDQIYELDSPMNEYLQTQFEILKSRDLARKVIDTLNLADNAEFKSEETGNDGWKSWLRQLPWLSPSTGPDNPDTLDPTEGLIDRFLENLTVSPRLRTQIVDVSFDAHDPVLARHIVQTLGTTYIESDLEARMNVARKAAEWLSKRLKGLRDKLAGSEQQLQAFLEEKRLVDLEGVLTVAAKEIDSNSLRLAEARTARIDAEIVYNKVRPKGGRINTSIEVVPELFQDPVIQGLKHQEAEISRRISELTGRYGPDHPLMLAARSELESIRTSQRNQTSSIISSIKSRYEMAKANERTVLDGLEASKAQVQSIGREQTRLRELQREVESDRALYEMFVNRSKETSESANLNTASIRFVDQANEPSIPIKPNKKRNVILAFVSALFFATVIAFFLEKLDSTLKSPDDVETLLAAPLLGIVPTYRLQKSDEVHSTDAGKTVIVRPNSAFFEAIRTIRTGMMLSSLDDIRKSWLITSSVMQEGKSTLAINLAFALSKMNTGKVLLIDADLRNNPSLTERFNLLPRGELGLADYLAHREKLDRCIHSVGENIDAMPAGEIPSNPSELLSSEKFSSLLDELADRYSAILIDSPPIDNVSDAQLLAQHVRGVLYVVKANATPLSVVQHGLITLERFNAPLAGVVLSQVDLSRYRGYPRYEYGYGYGRNDKFTDA